MAEEYDGQKPFFLEVGFPGPHPPCVPSFFRTLKRGRSRGARIQEDLDGQPKTYKGMRTTMSNDHDSVVHQWDNRRNRIRQRKHIWQSPPHNEKVGQIMKTLRRRYSRKHNHRHATTETAHRSRHSCGPCMMKSRGSPSRCLSLSGRKSTILSSSLTESCDLEIAGAELRDNGSKSILPALEEDARGRVANTSMPSKRI